MQHFALLHNPRSGRVSLIPLVPTKSGRHYTACQTLLTFADIAQAYETVPPQEEPHEGECVECGRNCQQLSANGYCEGCILQVAIERQETNR